jgi:hypothetical protein
MKQNRGNISKVKLINLKQTVRKGILQTCIGAIMNLRRIVSLELTWNRVRRVIC